METRILTYRVTAHTSAPGASTATVEGKTAAISFDTSATQDATRFGPADLLVTAFAACILKNVERMRGLLDFSYQGAAIEVTAEREERPPRIARIHYRLEIETDEPQRRLDLLHRNIARQGTIFNTLDRACEISGEVVAISPAMITGSDD